MSGATRHLQLIDRTMKSARKNILVATVAASFASVLVFMGVSWFLMYRYYRDVVEVHYRSIVQSALLVQERLLEGDGYRENLIGLVEGLAGNEGVVDAWATDRYGDLVYHTDPAFLQEYNSRRLPSGFHENLSEMWVFEDGRTVPVITHPDLRHVRVSLPLYASGREEPDFVIGIDGKRFILLPARGLPIAATFAGYILLAAALLFVPLNLLVRRRIRDIQNQTLVLAQVRTAADPAPGQKERSGAGERPTREGWSGPGQATDIDSEGAGSESVQAGPDEGGLEGSTGEESVFSGPDTGEPGLSETSDLEPSGADNGGDSDSGETEQAGAEQAELDPAVLFSRVRKRQFAAHTVYLPFVEGASMVLHPERTDGAYLFHHGAGSTHAYCLFTTPSDDDTVNIDMVPRIRTAIRKGVKPGTDLKELVLGINEFCLGNSIVLHVGLVRIDGDSGAVQFASCGKGYALYLKRGSSDVKELRLQVPALGEMQGAELQRVFESADIRFSEGDLFAVMPPNADDVRLRGKLFEYAVRDALIQARDSGPEKISDEIMAGFQSLEPDEQANLPVTGLVVLRYR